jgi:hypothetical protein
MESFEMIDFTLRELLFVIVTGHVVSRCCEQIFDSILTKLYEEEGVEARAICTRAKALALNSKP